MERAEQTRPIDEAVDPTTEEIVRERLKMADQEPSAAWSEVKRRVLSQPVAK